LSALGRESYSRELAIIQFERLEGEIMNPRKFSAAASAALLVVIAALTVVPVARAQYEVLYRFTTDFGNGGSFPQAGLTVDQAGNLYGTTFSGGANYSGVVFKLMSDAGGRTESVLYNFCSLPNCDDGASPYAGLVLDGAGNLYGTTLFGGTSCAPYGCGTVYKLAPNTDGTWTETAIYSFTGGNDGSYPWAGVVLDQTGNLYGTTTTGGAYGAGTVFEIAPNPGGGWAESTLYSFCSLANCDDGSSSQANLVFDGAGNLYGTTVGGGIYRAGAVFMLAPSGSGLWAESVIHSFEGDKGGANPEAALILDSAGNLYGTTSDGGTFGTGVVFELAPNEDGRWTESLLHQFTGGDDGAHPVAPLVFDSAGNLYGTTMLGGGFAKCQGGCGVVFKLIHPITGGRWSERVLQAFRGENADWPADALVLDTEGNLYGTATSSDNASTFAGVVFEIKR
jgi:uncharacterized repeat protein (TIGR03803 family)